MNNEKKDKIYNCVAMATTILVCGTCIFALYALLKVAAMVFGM